MKGVSTIEQANVVLKEHTQIVQKFEKITSELDALFSVLLDHPCIVEQTLPFSKSLQAFVFTNRSCLLHQCKELRQSLENIQITVNPDGNTF